MEKIYYSDDDIQVTSEQVLVQGQAYQIGNISKVKVSVKRVDLGIFLTVILLMFGAFSCAYLNEPTHHIFGLNSIGDIALTLVSLLFSIVMIVLVLGRFLASLLKRLYSVAVKISGPFGEIEIFRSSDIRRISRIVRAIRAAIGRR